MRRLFVALALSVAFAASGTELPKDPLELHRFLHDMPKGGDLHEHLSGAVYAETYLDWAMHDGLCVDRTKLAIAPPPCDAPLVAATSLRGDSILYGQMIDAMSMRNYKPAVENGHNRFFSTFSRFSAVARLHAPEMLASVVTRFSSENVDYIESLFAPDLGQAARLSSMLTPGASFADMRDTLLKSGQVAQVVADARTLLDATDAAAHKANPNTTIRYLYEVHRGYPREAFFSELVVAFEAAKADPRIVGLNPVMPEDSWPSMTNFNDQMQMFAYLRPLYPSVHLSAHAGELAPGLVPPEGLHNHIRDTVMIAKAERIGHGVDVAYESGMPELLKSMAEHHVAVEICLTSNDVILGITGRNHPLRLYMRNDVPVVLATDDPGVSRGDLTTEFQRAAEEQGLTYADLKRLARNSIEYSFLEPAAKARELQRLDRRLAAFEASH